MSNLVITSKAVAYGDRVTSTNPLRKNYDWTRALTIPVSNPKSFEEIVPAGGSFTFFNGTTATAIDGTTAFTVTRSSLEASRYRFTHSAGTAPALRTDRALTLSGQNLTVAVNSDATATLTLGGGTWGTTAAGDTLFIPGPTTGDASTPVNVLNQGFWTVLAVISSTVIQVARPTGEDFSAAGETVALTANAQVQAFSAAGVQAGDSVEISAGFATASQRTYTVSRVTPTWFEVVSTAAIPLEVGKIPTATGMIFYTNAKRFARVEADQEISLRLNGGSDDRLRLSPIQAGDPEQVGWFEKWGPTWSLIVVNKSSQPATITVFTAE